MKKYSDFETNRATLLADHQALLDYLRTKSISADPLYADEVLKAAQQTVDLLLAAGADYAFLIPTAGYPVVYGLKWVSEDLPTVLNYGHYDVQPAADEHFEPQIRTSELHPEGEIFGRGSSDDTGQVYMQIKAFEACRGQWPVNFVFCIEGEEEVGSRSFYDFLVENQALLAGDVVLISDTSIVSKDQPSIVIGGRGLISFELDLQGVENDLHSGVFGGATPNVIQIASKMLATLHDENYRVAIPGYYDGAIEFSAEARSQMQNPAFDDLSFRRSSGIPEWYGDPAYTPYERTTIRPTLEINGISAGYTGDGGKTIVPSRANIKFSMRLAPGQDPEHIYQLTHAFIEKQLSHYPVRILRLEKNAGITQPVLFPTNTTEYAAAEQAIADSFGKMPIPLMMGGSIGILSQFVEVLQVPNILMGFGLDTDAIHSPKEHFGLFNLFIGMETVKRFYQHYGQMKSVKGDDVRAAKQRRMLELAQAMS